MALTDYVTLSITSNTVGLTRLGFGTALLLSYKPTWTERTRTYSQYTDVLVDFPNTTGPEARTAAAYFSQNPAPTSLIIGRGANKPSKTVQLSAITPVSNVSYTYTVFVKGDGFADATVTFTSDATPTDAEWATGMVAALNGVAGKNYTAAGAASPLTITGNAVGNWFSIEVGDVNYQTVTETTADPGVAADLTAITAENPNWYGLLTTNNSKLYGVGSAVWIEANPPHIYLPDSNDTVIVSTATTGTADLMDQAKTNAYTRTAVLYHKNPAMMFAAAEYGKVLPMDPGSETWAFKNLAGVSNYPMTATHRANIIAKNGTGYESVAGINITFGATMAVGTSMYIDTKRSLDWLQDDLTKTVFGTLAGAPKVPYTDPGIAWIEGQVRGSLKRAADRGILIESTIVVTTPKLADVPGADKTARTLNNVKFSATLQGAMHKINVVGNVSA